MLKKASYFIKLSSLTVNKMTFFLEIKIPLTLTLFIIVKSIQIEIYELWSKNSINWSNNVFLKKNLHFA